ncbi:MAG: GIY-YIG nuclease family protein [Planctomycetes bacterium]|nr:GIY-YIG nuclease family protein [Planctomycetota bacterium]
MKAPGVGIAGYAWSRLGALKMPVTGRQLRLDGTVRCRPGQSIGIPDAAGVYIFHDLRGAIYVGRTKDLRRRFFEHQEVPVNKILLRARREPVGDLRFSWLLAERPIQDDWERFLVVALQPLANQITFREYAERKGVTTWQ